MYLQILGLGILGKKKQNKTTGLGDFKVPDKFDILWNTASHSYFAKLWVEMYVISENSTYVIGILCSLVVVNTQTSEVFS